MRVCVSSTKQEAKSGKTENLNWKKLTLELIVVFLGVTSGFLLNNWQLQRQDRKLEEKYKRDFIQDMDENINALQTAILYDSMWINNIKPKFLSIKQGTITVDSASALVKHIVEISKAEVQTGTYENITNSGNLNIISDFHLKKLIVDYHVSLDGVKYIDEFFYRYFHDYVMPFILTNFNMLKGIFDDPAILKTKEFANIIAGYYSLVQQRKTAYQKLLTESFTLKDALVNEQ